MRPNEARKEFQRKLNKEVLGWSAALRSFQLYSAFFSHICLSGVLLGGISTASQYVVSPSCERSHHMHVNRERLPIELLQCWDGNPCGSEGCAVPAKAGCVVAAIPTRHSKSGTRLATQHAVRCPRTALGSRSSSSSSSSSEEGSPNYRKKPWPTDAKNLTVAKTPCNSREKPIPVTVAKNHGYQWKKTPSPGCILCFLFGPNFAEFKKQTPTFSIMASPCTAPQTYPRRN